MKKIKFIVDKSYKNIGLKATSPAKNIIPQWYRESELDLDGPGSGGGLKRCVPFLDVFLSGYYIVLPKSIYIKNSNGMISLWSVDEFGKPLRNFEFGFLVDERISEELQKTFPVPPGYQNNKLTWTLPVGWRTPKGWSTLITHPINQFQLPFMTISGVVDSDRYASGGNLPFYIKDGWNGVIEAGTPIAQIIPFKREKWTSTITNTEDDDSIKIGQWMAKNNNIDAYRSPGFYRDTVWVKKEYM